MKKKEIYSFKLIPENELFYSDDSNYGVYKFSTIDDILYLEDNSYILFDKKPDNKTGTIVGNMQQLIMGEEYEVEATVEFNKKYNSWQYKPIRIVTKKPTNKDEQLRFLKSIITEKQSETLIEAYPNIVDDIINNKEIDLNKTKGIKEYTFSKIKKKVLDNYVIADVLSMLQPLGISYKMILKLVENEPNPTLLKIKLHDNPYILTKIHGLGFKRVDGLALKINPDIRISEKRTYAFLVYYFNEIGSNKGHTWVNTNKLKQIVKENVPECIEIFDEIIIKEKDNPVVLYVSDDRISLKRYYNIEKQIFKKINELQNSYSEYNINPKQAIINTQNRMGFELTDEQKEAIYSLVDNNVIVITANAGGGKTT
ncbi:MAG TPA: helix-hairpin-helix domain-containing protein, partial [Bacteroidales bacterium]|nr:helix-hairpin-helix domain-containing protein [Bacteroidales bacterium]